MIYNHSVIRRAAFLGLMKKSIAGLPTLGDILTWDLQGIQVRHGDLCQALEEHNFGYYIPPEPGAAKALERAINDWLDSRQHGKDMFSSGTHNIHSLASDGNKYVRSLLRPLAPNKSEYANAGFAVVLEANDPQNLELRYQTQLRVAVRADGTLIVSGSQRGRLDGEGMRPDLAAELVPYWSNYNQMHTSQDLAALFCRVVKGMDATPIRSCGGAYYVPAF
jgi:hypothetical protein